VTAIVAGTSFFNQNAEGLNLAQVREDPRQPNPDALTFNEYQRTRRATVGVVGDVAVAPGHALSFAAYGRHTEWQESVPSAVQHRTFDSPGATLQYTWTASHGGRANRLSAGADLDWQQIDEIKHPNLGGGVENAEALADQTIRQRSTGVWVLDSLELTRGLNLVVSGRHDAITNRLADALRADGIDLSGRASFSRSTARVGFAWSLAGQVDAYASWGQGFLPPATEELANNPARQGGFNRGLVPATSYGSEMGVRGLLGGRLFYDLAAFRLVTHDDFGRYRIADRPLETFYRNAGDSTRWGVESLLGWSASAGVAVNLAYTYSHFVYDRVGVADLTLRGTRLPNSPDHQAYLDAAWEVSPGLTVGASVELVSRAYIDATNTTWIGGTTLYHARAAWRFSLLGAPGELSLSVRNLTGKRYIAFTEPDPDGNSYQPGPTREVFSALSMTL
jgi:iron complex outermembrane receptor protein